MRRHLGKKKARHPFGLWPSQARDRVLGSWWKHTTIFFCWPKVGRGGALSHAIGQCVCHCIIGSLLKEIHVLGRRQQNDMLDGSYALKDRTAANVFHKGVYNPRNNTRRINTTFGNIICTTVQHMREKLLQCMLNFRACVLVVACLIGWMYMNACTCLTHCSLGLAVFCNASRDIEWRQRIVVACFGRDTDLWLACCQA